MTIKLPLFFIFLIGCSSLMISQTGPGGAGSSTNNKLWLDANRGISLSGSNVTAWSDRSGNGNNAAPAATANRPTYVSSSINGNASLDFDGTDDELRVPYNSGFDLTSWHLFIVVIADAQKDYNAWMVKGNDGQENYEMLSYATANIHTPTYYTDNSRTSPSSGGSQVTTTEFNVFEYTFSAAVGRDVYKNMTSINTDDENKTPAINTFDLYIGNEKTTSRYVDGDIAEIAIFNAPLNTAQRYMVNNYLSAKYNVAIASNDYYAGDTPGNGNYDYEVAGIGRTSAGNTSTSASSAVSGGLDITQGTVAFEDAEYLLYGHQTGNNAMNFVDIAGMSAGPLVGRWNRIWYLDWTHSAGSTTSENANLTFDISDAGMTAVPATPLTNYKLLYRAGTSGSWTEAASATSITGDRISFNGIAYTQGDGYYTIGTLNNTLSPLPIELLTFNAVMNDAVAELSWSTATETDNDHFTIEKSKDAINFEQVATIKGAGNSTTMIDYFETDQNPYVGISYYRLKQTDFNGKNTYSNIVPVEYDPNGDPSISLFPNPSDANSAAYLALNKFDGQEVLVVLRDITGRELFSKVIISTSNNELFALNQDGKLAKGTYLITASSANKLYSKHLIVK